MDLSSLRHLIQSHPLIDNHAHNLLTQSAACNYAKYPFEQITSEAQGTALKNAPTSLPLWRAAAQLQRLYGCASADWDAVKRARDEYVQRDYDGLVRRCMQGTHAFLLDDLLTDQDIEPYAWHDRYAAARTRRIVRIEALAARTLSTLQGSGTDFNDDAAMRDVWQKFRHGVEQQIAEAIADPAVVGFKSVVCYRTGLNVQAHDDPDDSIVIAALSRYLRREGSPRVEDKPLNDWLVRLLLSLVQAAGVRKPLQLHTGLGDNDIDLVFSNPAYLQPLVARFTGADFVLLHSAYPYTREAGYLACVYDNVYLDLGEVFPMVSRDAQEAIVRQALEIVPTNRLLWSTDGHFFPETFWLANVQFRDALETVLVNYVQHGDFSLQQARSAAADILFHNSNRAYALNETLSSDSFSLSARPSSSSTSQLDIFLRDNPDIKYIWMQFLDYTATTRVRIFPVREFRKIVARQRRIGICLAVQWMIQSDCVAPEGSVTGQFYMQPDLGTLRRNAGLSSPSASVMTFWQSETNHDQHIPGCPRSLLHNLTNTLQHSHNVTVTCGFEIEVIFLKPSTSDPSTFTPSVSNHSWSQMTPDTRALLPILEEIAETLESVDIHLEQFHAESAPGQFEFILPPASPLAAIDTLLQARQIVTHVAEKHNLRATLHPRPIPSAAGTAAHAHISITPPTQEDAFLAGIMAHYPALVAFTLSQDASYDRVQSGLWAGSEWVAWGSQNRETPIRKISPGHWEVKSLDGLANMYLAMAALLGAGLVGLKKGMPLTVKDCLYDAATLSPTARSDLGITTQLPKSLSESLTALEADTELQDVLGKELVANYIIVKRLEGQKLKSLGGEEEQREWLVQRY
ncbi:extracellular developmental signal biosynthesis protein FluG [Aspergillus steynii IBT 23096]|uniref:Extracellular developmental signal biosynthesis protein FluG n=1 Tax=Aspergillus steynii IBT 23096 TaxID=1392250 RepID=A0A2I2GI39_9EURO|nr:extracellular developmental signal biosynthesis protein FluG [Aspergillus steynii IBT 23096]PLB52534.1 extracellular developmental signal biosynthesis protein FluG [Aspergillus steynii IBT 23096]